MTTPDKVTVSPNSAENRYEAIVDGHLCVAEYAAKEDTMIFTHTFVPPELRGQGIAERIVRFALDDVRTKKLKVVPACSYVERFIQRHSEYRDLLA